MSNQIVTPYTGDEAVSLENFNRRVEEINAGAAPAEHEHSAGDVTSGTLPAERGGTGQASLQAARNAMGLGNTTGALPVANGGTGQATAAGVAKLASLLPAQFANPSRLTAQYGMFSSTGLSNESITMAQLSDLVPLNSSFWFRNDTGVSPGITDVPYVQSEILFVKGATENYCYAAAFSCNGSTAESNHGEVSVWSKTAAREYGWRRLFDDKGVIPVANGGTGQATAAGVAKLASLLPAEFSNPSRLTAHYNTFLSTGLSNESITISQLADLVPARTAFWFRNNTNETPGVTDVPYVSSEILFDKGANNNYCYAVAFSCNGDTAESNHGEVSVWSKNTLREYGWRRLFDDKGVVPVANGGTGAATKAAARSNLGVFVQSGQPSGPAAGDVWLW